MANVLVAQKSELTIKDITVNTDVPKNATAQLLYYLNCVDTIIKLVELNIDEVDNSFVRMVKNYKNCLPFTMTNQEKQKILRIARKLSPNLFENKIFFRTASLNGRNRFFEINSSEITVAATDEVFIGGMIKKIQKIMLYKSDWLQIHYYDAIRDLERELGQLTRTNTQFIGLFRFFISKLFHIRSFF
jgi:hypothetical protein